MKSNPQPAAPSKENDAKSEEKAVEEAEKKGEEKGEDGKEEDEYKKTEILCRENPLEALRDA